MFRKNSSIEKYHTDIDIETGGVMKYLVATDFDGTLCQSYPDGYKINDKIASKTRNWCTHNRS